MAQTSAKPGRQLVLGSTSPFRRELLERLGLDFVTASPNIDESPMPDEPPDALVLRLAKQKALSVAQAFPSALIIGSDQVATIDGKILGKPASHARAVEQLSMASGRRVTFLTGLCLLNSDTGRTQLHCEPFHVHFRNLRTAIVADEFNSFRKEFYHERKN